MSFNFVENINALSREQRLHFYELLANNLTVSIRAVWSDSKLSDAEKVDQVKWINELAHQVTSKVYVLRLNTHEWTEEDMYGTMHWAINQNPSIKVHLANAIRISYSKIMGS